MALVAGLLLLHWQSGVAPGQNPVKTFAYVGSNYIITAEVAGKHSFVVNFINLSDFVIVIQPQDLIYKGASGRFYIGQVFEQERKDNKGEIFKYSASILLKGRSFTGLTVDGFFHEQDQIEQLSIRIGSKRFYLEGLDQVEFEQLAAKIGELDLKNADSRVALQEANIAETGKVTGTDGTSEWDRDWQGLVTTDGINKTRIIEMPEVTPTEEARRTNTYGKVKLQATINKNGGIQDLKVLRGLGRGLDERAMEAVKNSWVFLPASKNGEVVESVVVFDVEIKPASQKTSPTVPVPQPPANENDE
jgi:TonB family protein